MSFLQPCTASIKNFRIFTIHCNKKRESKPENFLQVYLTLRGWISLITVHFNIISNLQSIRMFIIIIRPEFQLSSLENGISIVYITVLT